MGNPFEDLRQAVVVRPMNSPGPQGVAGPEIKIQYSNEGSSWHEIPVQTDRYLRFSTDNGVSWSDAIYFNNLVETLVWVEKAKQWATNPENALVENDKYSALHHATRAAKSEFNAEAAALNAAESAAEAFGAVAPAWNSTTIYNYNDVVSFDNGHTYRCIGTNIFGEDHAPNINGVDNVEEWTRITVSPDGYFEIDENGNLMPMITPITSEIFMLDENGDIMYQPDILPPSTIIQYSSDGATWHENPSDTDIFIRFSTDFGASWGEPIRFVNLSEALAWVYKAQQWAENPEDVEVEPGQYSAYHWAQKAEDIVISPIVEDQIVDGVTNKAPSQNAVYDALASLTAPSHGDEAHTENYIKEGDPRLTDARTPTNHASTHIYGTDNIQLATSEQKGLMSDVYAAKLDGIEENANNYVHPATHSLDMITETDVLKIFTADERDRLSTLGGIPI